MKDFTKDLMETAEFMYRVDKVSKLEWDDVKDKMELWFKTRKIDALGIVNTFNTIKVQEVFNSQKARYGAYNNEINSILILHSERLEK